MERRNYFEILGLPFDPPESNKKKIEDAIAAWQTRTSSAMANETPTRRKALQDELALLDNMKEVLLETKSRNLEAKAMKELRVAQLEKLLDIMCYGQSGKPEITRVQMKSVSQKLGLAEKTVEITYQQKGFTIHKRPDTFDLKSVFMTPSTANSISGMLEQLRGLSVPKYPWTSKVFDLYDLACFYSGGSEADAANYHRKRTQDLRSIMESAASQIASDLSDSGHLLADLFTAGITHVFDSETTRKKYDQTLERDKLKSFFTLVKSAPEEIKKDSYFADNCVQTIRKSFPDYDLALALYNQEAGLMQDPYEPPEVVFHVVCPSCGADAQFRKLDEAQKAACAACGTPLYTECPKCHKKVPAAADRCSCGFRIFEMRFFDEYYNAAMSALKNMELSEARRQLENAENANPGHPKLAALRKQVQDEVARYQKPLDDLKALISAGQFCKAQALLGTLNTSMPQLKLDTQRKLIMDKLAEAQKRMPPAADNSFDAANRCVEVLQIVRDYQPALDKLRTIRPRTPGQLRLSTVSEPGVVNTLTWSASGDSGVTYKVVRKKEGIPQQHADGEVLAADLTAMEFTDETAKPGICYGYAVFAARQGAYSEPATCEAVSYSELDPKKLRTVADDSVCRFEWELPDNCVGVRILRRNGALPAENPGSGNEVVAACAAGGFEDTKVTNDTTYGYRLQCVYSFGTGYRYSRGRTVLLKPIERPSALQNVTAKVENGQVTVKWTPVNKAQYSVVVCEVNASAARMMTGVLSAAELQSIANGRRLCATTNASAGQCQFDIPGNSICDLAIILRTSSSGIISEVVRVSSVAKCEINRLKTKMLDPGRLQIAVTAPMANLVNIHYLVAQKTGIRIPWATEDDAKYNRMSQISAGDYKKDGVILVENPAQTDLYITVIGQYRMSDGTMIYAEPSKCKISNKPKVKITYNIVWGGIFRRKATDAQLIITANASEVPELRLIYRKDGYIPMNPEDASNILLLRIPEYEGTAPYTHTYHFPNSVWSDIPAGTELRLMLSEDDVQEYELECLDLTALKVPHH